MGNETFYWDGLTEERQERERKERQRVTRGSPKRSVYNASGDLFINS